MLAHMAGKAWGDSHGGAKLAEREHLLDLLPAEREQLAAAAEARAALERVRLPKLSATRAGWLQGAGVKREPLPAANAANGSWHFGYPIGFLNHFTDGCGDPFATLKSRGVSVHGCVLQDGSLVQYFPFTVCTAHAYDQAVYTLAFESAAAPGVGCEYTVPMLERMAQVNAVALDWIRDVYNVDIPTVRSPGWHYEPGIKCHTDGLEPGCPWDPKDHWDAPWKAEGDPIDKWIWRSAREALNRSPWTSQQFIDAVKRYRGEEDELALLSDKDQKDIKAFLDGVRGMGSKKDPSKPASATGAGQRVAHAVRKIEDASANVSAHSHDASVRVGKPK
jgi:hypothetical protein